MADLHSLFCVELYCSMPRALKLRLPSAILKSVISTIITYIKQGGASAAVSLKGKSGEMPARSRHCSRLCAQKTERLPEARRPALFHSTVEPTRSMERC